MKKDIRVLLGQILFFKYREYTPLSFTATGKGKFHTKILYLHLIQ
jgi:hypothetical protein